MPEVRDDFAKAMNDHRGGFNRAMGFVFVKATPDEVIAEWDVGEQHLQPYGIVHGGVHAGIVETLCSVGATLSAQRDDRTVVGIENHTSFIKAVRSGRLRATARPLRRGQRLQLWEANVTDEAGQLIASGRVRLMCLERGAELAGSGTMPKPA
jgi:1,4-dihydroxy-2-naphthoyl-CoA hydrolase